MAAQFYLAQMVDAMRTQTHIDILGYRVFSRQLIEALDDGLDRPATSLEFLRLSSAYARGGRHWRARPFGSPTAVSALDPPESPAR